MGRGAHTRVGTLGVPFSALERSEFKDRSRQIFKRSTDQKNFRERM